MLANVLFRTTSLEGAGVMWRQLFVPHGGLGSPRHATAFGIALTLAVVGHLFVARGWDLFVLRRTPPSALGLGYAMALTMALVLAPDVSNAFVYFQF